MSHANPENKARYPRDWKQIRAAILERAGHRCEQCGVPNHWYRNKFGDISERRNQKTTGDRNERAVYAS